MRTLVTLSLSACLALLLGCGSEIGDSCQYYTECSPTGDRSCAAMPGGYCTIVGCDHDSCPDEAVCVRFFSVASSNIGCNPLTEDVNPDELTAAWQRAYPNEPVPAPTDDCNVDELCTMGGSCVPRSAESRYCMRKCSDDGDCRDKYHCRTRDLMDEFGGEPVVAPGEFATLEAQPFCAEAPTVVEEPTALAQ